MKAYLQNVIMVTTGCHLVLLAAGSFTGEKSKKILRFLCGLIVLLTLFAPLQDCIEGIEDTIDKLFAETDMDENIDSEELREYTVSESAYVYIADRWITYIADTYGLEREQIKLVIVTDEAEALTELQVFLYRCPYAIREKVRADLEAQISAEVHVFGE